MRKKNYVIVAIMLLIAMLMTACSGSSGDTTEDASSTEEAVETSSESGDEEETAETQDTYLVGMTVQDISNATWAAQINQITEECEAMGWTVTATQNDNDAAKTITQIENFISSGCDFIIIQSSQGAAIADVVAEAQSAGICVIGDGVAIDIADMNYTNDNYLAGYYCGEFLGNWANETFGEDYVLKVAQYQYDEMTEITDRTDGQIAGLEATHPNYEIVAVANPTDSATAMEATESVLTAHPEIEAIFNWGDSMALGTLEVVRSQGIDEDLFCIVSVDGTDEALAEIKAGSALKMTASLGGPEEQGSDMVKMLVAYVEGTNEDHYYSPTIAVDASNVDDYL